MWSVDRLALIFLGCAIGCGQAPAPQSAATVPPPAPAVVRETSYVAPSVAASVVRAPDPPVASLSTPARREPAPKSYTPAPPPAPNASMPDRLVEEILGAGGAAVKGVLATPEKFRFQVLYSVVTAGAKPALERHPYRADAEYFYPASSMKVPIALATYDRLAVLRTKGKPGLTRDATLRFHAVAGGGEPQVTTLAREMWRALIVSDNVSANRLLAFVGHREVHETLWPLGLASARLHHGFATGGDIDPAELSPKIEVALEGGGTDEIPPRRSDLALPPTNAIGLAIGQAFILDGRRVEGPLSFAEKNAMRLYELQDTLVRIMRPELLPRGSKASAASKEDLAAMRQALGTLPSQSGLAGFERNVVADYQLIPFLKGIERVRPRGRFEIYSKVGQAFGFLIGNAYVVDKDTGRAFFLTAAVYANPDEILNDDLYAYDTISFPALADVGEAIARHAFATR